MTLTLFASRLLTTVALSAVATTFVMAQESRQFALKNFDKLDMGSAFSITVRQGSAYNVRATGRAEDLDDLDVVVSGGTLEAGYKNRMGNYNRKRVTFEITMPTLKGVTFSGATTSTISGFRRQGNVAVEISGASNSTIDLDADQLELDVSGASDVTLKGRADRIEGDVSGASELKAFDLAAKNVAVEVSGASSARVLANESLTIQASGASSVQYRGTASNIRSSTSGASSVRKQG